MARLEQLDGLIRSKMQDPRILNLAPLKSLSFSEQKEQS
jgi:hypothetical protein